MNCRCFVCLTTVTISFKCCHRTPVYRIFALHLEQIMYHVFGLNARTHVYFCHKLCIPGIHRYDEFYKRVAVSNDWICPQCNGSIFPFNHIDDDDDFLICLSEQWHVSYSTNIKKLRDKVFNPLFNYDPDFHYYNLVCNSLSACDYYLEDAFNEKCEELTLSSRSFS